MDDPGLGAYVERCKRSSGFMRTKLQLALLGKLRQRKGLAKGFTLIELMIVVAIIGILAAVALPQFLSARQAADAGSKVGEVVGLAKECSTWVTSGGVGTAPTPASSGTPPVADPQCTIEADTVITRTWAGAGVDRLKCLDQISTTTSTTVTVTVTAVTGTMACAFS